MLLRPEEIGRRPARLYELGDERDEHSRLSNERLRYGVLITYARREGR